jgi:hypothetical protein
MVEILPYQDGSTFPSEDNGSPEILASAAITESEINNALSCNDPSSLQYRLSFLDITEATKQAPIEIPNTWIKRMETLLGQLLIINLRLTEGQTSKCHQ